MPNDADIIEPNPGPFISTELEDVPSGFLISFDPNTPPEDEPPKALTDLAIARLSFRSVTRDMVWPSKNPK